MFVDSVLNMPVEELELKEKDILGNFPNSYTFTKNIGEKLLNKHRGDLPMVIVRPSIIGAAAQEPYPGWVDSISAATAVYLTGGLGMLKDLYGRMDFIGDQVPVDYCAHLIIAATADGIDKNTLTVYHSASSSRNPISWAQTSRYFWPFITRNIFEKKITYPSFDMYRTKSLYKLAFFVKRKIPAQAYYYTAKAIGNPKMKKNSERYLKALTQCKTISDHFGHFTNNEWIYDSYNSYQLKARMIEEDVREYKVDIAELDWKTYFPIFSYGIQKYLLKEEVEPPFGPRTSVLSHNPKYFYDYVWVFYHGKNQKTRNAKALRRLILSSDRVRMAIREVVQKEMVTSNLSEAKLLQVQQNRSNEVLDRLAAKMNFNRMRGLGLLMHKIFKSMYDKVIINKGGIEKVKELNERTRGNVVYCPTHRSYVDFLIMSFILYAYDIKVPHICAGDDFLNIAVVHTLLRNSGAFFMKRSFKDDPLYKSIFYEYVQSLLNDGHSLEFFLEGTRARSGKMLSPKFGLLNVLTNAYFDNKVDDLHFVPITINYSRVLEGETFPLEILGESKVKESLSRIINASRYVTMNFGTIYIEMAEPISFKSYAQELIVKENLQPSINKADQKFITSSLGYHLVRTLSKNLIIMPTSICASILLMHRKGISEDELIKQVEYLINVLKTRNAMMPSY